MGPYGTYSITSSYLPTDQFHIHYVHKGAGPPLILLHGGGTWLYSFRHNIDALSRLFSVYAMDLPGHGYTRPLVNISHYDRDTIFCALINFMDTLGIESAHLIGHSWGGGWATLFAYMYPARVSKLVLINSSGLNKHEHFVWECMKIPIIGEILFKLLNSYAIKRGLQDSFHDKSFVTSEMIDQILKPLQMKENIKAHLSYARTADWKIAETVLGQIRSPALVVWGRHDRYIDIKYGQRMADIMPNARFVILENCGHSSHEECPEKVNHLIIEFLKCAWGD